MCWKIIAIITENARNNTRNDLKKYMYSVILHQFPKCDRLLRTFVCRKRWINYWPAKLVNVSKNLPCLLYHFLLLLFKASRAWYFDHKLCVSQRGFRQHHSQKYITDSLNLTAFYPRQLLTRVRSQRNVKFQSIIRKVNASYAERSCLSLDIGNVRFLLNKKRRRERESVFGGGGVRTCTRICMRVSPLLKNSVTAELKTHHILKQWVTCFPWE
jgi:hypothetical protein